MPVVGLVDNWIEMAQSNWLVILKGLLQVSILVGLIYFIYNSFIRQSQAERLLKGVFITLLTFVAFWLLARLVQFKILEVVFGASIQILFIGLIVIFQPELRRMLLFLGQSELFGFGIFSSGSKEQKAENLVKYICESVRFLSKSKRGALIVLESPNNPGGEYLEAGTPINAQLTTELLLTIFHPNTPLHDGAVIIGSDNRLSAAGVLLPLTENPELSWQYGTRHRAAIGLTEMSDSRCLVISEETGNISLAYQGELEKIEAIDDLQKKLEDVYQVSLKSGRMGTLGKRFSNFFSMNTLPGRIQKIFERDGEKEKKGPKQADQSSSRKIS